MINNGGEEFYKPPHLVIETDEGGRPGRHPRL